MSLTIPLSRLSWMLIVFLFSYGPALTAAPLPLAPTLSLTAPNGGQTLTPTDSTTLTWTSSGLSGYIRIELSRDNGSTWELLTGSAGNTGSWLWRIAGAGTTEGLIRVSSVSDPSVTDTSDAPFTIKQSQLTVLTPNGGQRFQQGDGLNISWTGVNFYGGVKVELSRDNGLQWELLSSGNPNSGSTVWSVQGPITDQGLIRVTALRSAETTDTSDLPFSLLESTLVLTSPNGGQTFTPGDGLGLVWTGTNFFGGVNVDLSRDLGASWERIMTGAAVSAQTTWLVRGQGTTQALIRVSSVRNPSLFDVSNAPFTIRQSQLSLTSPNGGELLTPGDITSFTWTGANFLGGFTLELSRDNGTSWETLSTQYATSGSYSWRVQGQGSTQALARVTPLRLPELVDTSNANFTIKQASLTLTTPNGGQNFTPGDGMLLTWSGSNFVGGVNVELSRDNGATWEILLSGAPASSSTSWTIRGNGTSTALVRVSSSRLPEITDRSDAVFTIKQASLTLLSPNGGEQVFQGETRNVTWSVANLIGTIQVELSQDNGSTWETLTSSAANRGPYSWTVPQESSNSAVFRIRSSRLPELTDSSDSVFQINPVFINLTRPAGTTSFIAGSTETLSWDTNSSGPFMLEYSGNGGQSWSTLADSHPSTSYSWVVDTTATSQGLIRVSPSDSPHLSATNPTPFAIVPPQINITFPGAGSSYAAGRSIVLNWTSNFAGPFKVEYSGNDGSTWTTLSDNVTSNTYSWRALVSPSTQGVLRVSATPYPNFTMASQIPVTILNPALTLNTPSSSYPMGATAHVSWSSTVTGPHKVEFSPDAGVSWNTLTSSATNRLFSWPVNTAPTTQGFFRVSPVAYPDVFATHTTPFTILEPQLTLIAPAGGEIFTPGDGMHLTWSSSGFVGSVNVELSRNDGSTWETLISGAAINNSTTWPIRGEGTTTGKIRISAANLTGVSDVSDPAFTILQSHLELLSPNAGQTFTPGTPVTLTWSRANFLGGVDLAVSMDGGSTWTTLSTLNFDTSYVWTAGSQTTTQGLFRVSSSRIPSLADLSDSPFSVAEGTVTLTSPTAGGAFDIGSYVPLSHTTNCVGPFHYELSWDAGQTWSQIASTSTTTASWLVAGPVSTPGLIRVVFNRDPLIQDVADAPITISPYSVELTSPSGGEAFNQGEIVTLQWIRNHHQGALKAELSLDNGVTWQYLRYLGNGTTTTTTWMVLENPSTTALIRIVNNSDNLVLDTLDAPFTIKQGRLTITAPNGGESFATSTYMRPTVTKENVVGNLTYQLSRDGGINWTQIGYSAGDFSWLVSGSLTQQAMLRVYLSGAQGVSDTSDAVFTIESPRISLTSPTAGESFEYGSTMAITWTQNFPENSIVQVNYTGGTSWSQIGTGNGSFNWTVSNSVTNNNAYIRVIKSIGSAYFGQVGPLSLIYCPTFGTLGSISSPTTVCGGTPASYSVPALSGAVSYTWIPAVGYGRVVSGQGTPNAVIVWDRSGLLEVVARNSCQNTSVSSKSISINAGFTGGNSALQGSTVAYVPENGNGDWVVSCQNCTSSVQGRTLTVVWGAPEVASISLSQGACTNERAIQITSSLAPDFAAIGTGDIDNNGLDDLIWYQPTTRECRAWLSKADGVYQVVALPTRTEGFWRYLGMVRTTETGPKGMLWVDGMGDYELMSATSEETWSMSALPMRVDGWPLGLADVDGDGEGELLTVDPEGATWVNVLGGRDTIDRFLMESEVAPNSEIDLLIRSAGRTRPLDEDKGWWYLGSLAISEDTETNHLYYNPMNGELGLSQPEDSELSLLWVYTQEFGEDRSKTLDPEVTVQLERRQIDEVPE